MDSILRDLLASARSFRKSPGLAVTILLLLALGIPIALWSKPLLASFLYGAGSLEPMVLATVPLLFGLIAVAASCGPARHATAIDPAITLRQE
ncbi:MAG TPA: hypothetical protein VIX89_05265 [Bryobacteraceae bacterium]